jgi:putative DNA primase/helicase
VECHKRGIRFTWTAKGTRLSPADRKAFAAKAAEDRKRREREERERHELTAKTAAAILAKCQDATPDHPYLDRKRIGPHGLKVDSAGHLVIPLRDQKSKIWSVQTIAQDGAKLFLKGGRKLGLFYLIGELGDRIAIAEGFATGASIAEATGHPVVVALDCGNLKPVARAIRELSPLAEIVIAADDDHATVGNPGVTKARDAAELVGAAAALPEFLETEERGTDFNDLAALRGHEPVAAIVGAAFAALDEPPPDDDPAPSSAPTEEEPTDPQPAPATDTAPQRDDWEARLLEAVEELNAKHFVAPVSGQTVIATLEDDADSDEAGRGFRFEAGHDSDLKPATVPI